MLDKETAAIAHFVEHIIPTQYFDIIPSDIATPSIFFPEPEVVGESHSLGSFKMLYVMYCKVFAESTVKSSAIAKNIVKHIMEHQKTIPLYEESGELSGKSFMLERCSSRNIEVGVSQIQLEWYTYEDYYRSEGAKANTIVINGLATSVEQEEDDGTEQGQ